MSRHWGMGELAHQGGKQSESQEGKAAVKSCSRRRAWLLRSWKEVWHGERAQWRGEAPELCRACTMHGHAVLRQWEVTDRCYAWSSVCVPTRARVLGTGRKEFPTSVLVIQNPKLSEHLQCRMSQSITEPHYRASTDTPDPRILSLSLSHSKC